MCRDDCTSLMVAHRSGRSKWISLVLAKDVVNLNDEQIVKIFTSVKYDGCFVKKECSNVTTLVNVSESDKELL